MRSKVIFGRAQLTSEHRRGSDGRLPRPSQHWRSSTESYTNNRNRHALVRRMISAIGVGEVDSLREVIRVSHLFAQPG